MLFIFQYFSKTRFDIIPGSHADFRGLYLLAVFQRIPLTAADVCDALGIGKNTVYKLIRCGQLKSIRCGRQLRIPKEALRSFAQ